MTRHEREQRVIRKARNPEALQRLVDEPDNAAISRRTIDTILCLSVGGLAVLLGFVGHDLGLW